MLDHPSSEENVPSIQCHSPAAAEVTRRAGALLRDSWRAQCCLIAWLSSGSFGNNPPKSSRLVLDAWIGLWGGCWAWAGASISAQCFLQAHLLQPQMENLLSSSTTLDDI